MQPSRKLATPALVVAIVIALWLGVAAVVRIAYSDRILPGTQMAGVSLGGRSSDDAQRLLASAFAPARPVALSVAGRRFVLTPRQIGYRIDAPASAERARDAGRTGPLRGLWSSVVSLLATRRLEPIAAVDERQLQAQLAAIARFVDRPASDGALVADASADAGIRAVAPRSGRALARAAAAAALVTALRDRRGGPLALPVRVQPAPSRAEVQEALDRAREYLREPVRLRTPMRLADGTRTVTLEAARMARILALERVPGAGRTELRPGVDASAMNRLLSALAADLDREPVNARIRAPGRPSIVVDAQGDLRWRPRAAQDVRVTPGASGRQLRRTAARTAIARAVRSGRHTVALGFSRRAARVATKPAKTIDSLLGTFTTRYVCCQPRVTNIRLIAKAVDGSVVLPGERFSLNQATGKRTRRDGYVEAPFIAEGRLVPSVGGGVSQFSTTLYNAAYFAGLRLDAHQPHSFYIDRYPPGREATLNFPDIDLAWTNDTTAPVLIRAVTDATSVTVSLYGADHARRVRSRTGPRVPIPGGDFSITVTRAVRYRDGQTKRQAYTTRYERPPAPE